jgi:hypothetical protein
MYIRSHVAPSALPAVTTFTPAAQRIRVSKQQEGGSGCSGSCSVFSRSSNEWHIEAGFETATGDCGLADYEVRTWDAWRRSVTVVKYLMIIGTSLMPQQEYIRKDGIV